MGLRTFSSLPEYIQSKQDVVFENNSLTSNQLLLGIYLRPTSLVLVLEQMLQIIKKLKYPYLFQLPDNIWTEEYQLGVLSEHFKAFDNLRKKGWFIGEMIWNFADFRTDQCKYI